MNVHTMVDEILRISNAMVGESSFPNFDRTFQILFHGMRVSALDELKCSFERDRLRRQQ